MGTPLGQNDRANVAFDLVASMFDCLQKCAEFWKDAAGES